MSDLLKASDGLFLGSALFNKEGITYLEIKKIWEERFGPSVEFHHYYFPMKDYYSKQMGQSDQLSRVIFTTLNPRSREELVAHKIWADQLEKKVEKDLFYRGLNLDIGLMTLENLTLATGKNFSHRIYLGDGVYSDLNLQFENKSFKALPWAYPDYAHPDFIKFFNWVRGFLHRKISEKNT